MIGLGDLPGDFRVLPGDFIDPEKRISEIGFAGRAGDMVAFGGDIVLRECVDPEQMTLTTLLVGVQGRTFDGDFDLGESIRKLPESMLSPAKLKQSSSESPEFCELSGAMDKLLLYLEGGLYFASISSTRFPTPRRRRCTDRRAGDISDMNVEPGELRWEQLKDFSKDDRASGTGSICSALEIANIWLQEDADVLVAYRNMYAIAHFRVRVARGKSCWLFLRGQSRCGVQCGSVPRVICKRPKRQKPRKNQSGKKGVMTSAIMSIYFPCVKSHSRRLEVQSPDTVLFCARNLIFQVTV